MESSKFYHDGNIFGEKEIAYLGAGVRDVLLDLCDTLYQGQ